MADNINWIDEHPVSFVKWVETEKISANDYNPNAVAPPEMKLLELSIVSDGYTQPIVVWEDNNKYEVIDGFHRFLIGRKLKMSHLPIVTINSSRNSKEDRIAATIRHNRARGKHQIDSMSNIVLELSKRNWSDKK
jgi:ParB-like chromosome segregation protein Spo0J